MSNHDKERAEFERVVSEMFSVDECSFKRDGSFGPYLYMVTSQNYPGQPSGGEFIKTQSLWNLWQARSARIAEIEAHSQSLSDALEALLIEIDNTPLEIRIINTAIAAGVKLAEFKAMKGGA